MPKAGIAYVPQGRRLFAEMTVAENLEIGLMARGKGARRGKACSTFPVAARATEPALRHAVRRRTADAGHGARAGLEPDVLLLDEPTEGLMPSMIAKIRETVEQLGERGVIDDLVEQRVDAVLPVADRVTFVENGRARETVSRRSGALRSGAGEALCRSRTRTRRELHAGMAHRAASFPASRRGRWRDRRRAEL